MILVPLMNPKFATSLAARCVRTSGWGTSDAAGESHAARGPHITLTSRAAIDPVIAPAEIGEDLVADSAHAGGEVIDAHAIADEGGEIAAPRGAFGQLADVDGEEVHGHAARDRAAPAGHDRLGRGLAPGGRRRPKV